MSPFAVRVSRIVFAVLILLAGTGCWPPKATEIAPKEITRLHRVAVVSIMGNELHQVHIGTTVLTDRSSHLPVPAWDMDSFVTDVARERLRRCRGIEFVPLPADAITIESVYGSVPQKYTQMFSLTHIKDKLEVLARQFDIDAFIIIVRRSDASLTSKPVHGYSFCAQSLMGRISAVAIFLSVTIRVVDAKTFEDLGEATIYTQRGVDPLLWRDDLSTLPPKDLARIEAVVKGFLRERLNSSMIEIGFSGS